MSEIDKCVVYVSSMNPMSRLNFVEVDGKQKIPITLPRLKILDDCEEEGQKKYHPYVVENYKRKRKPEEQTMTGVADGLTIRQRRAYELFRQGESVVDIARGMRTSFDSVRNMIYVAKKKMGDLGDVR
jgi:hypothetical protein